MPEAQKFLQHADPILGKVITSIVLAPLKLHDNYFRSLVESIISQQLSVKAADTIFNRFVKLFGNNEFPSAKRVLDMPARTIQSAGLSKQKVHYIKNVARAAGTSAVNFSTMQRLGDEEIIMQLTQIKGIGRWTAEMFLIFSLGRPDVFSYGDLGLRNAMRQLYGLRKEPSVRRAEQISILWRPYRSYACRYLWASIDNRLVPN